MCLTCIRNSVSFMLRFGSHLPRYHNAYANILKSGGRGNRNQEQFWPHIPMSGNTNTSNCLAIERKSLVNCLDADLRRWGQATCTRVSSISLFLNLTRMISFLAVSKFLPRANHSECISPQKIPVEIPFLMSQCQKRHQTATGQLLPGGWLSWDGLIGYSQASFVTAESFLDFGSGFISAGHRWISAKRSSAAESFSESDTSTL